MRYHGMLNLDMKTSRGNSTAISPEAIEAAAKAQAMIRNVIAKHATNHLIDDGGSDKHFWHAVCDGCGESIAPGQHVHQAALIWDLVVREARAAELEAAAYMFHHASGAAKALWDRAAAIRAGDA